MSGSMFPGNMIDVIHFGISLRGFTGAPEHANEPQRREKHVQISPEKNPTRNSSRNEDQDVTGGRWDATCDIRWICIPVTLVLPDSDGDP